MGKRKPIEFYVDENGCFICTSHLRDRSGYARINLTVNGKTKKTSVHRFIYQQCFGDILENKVLMHKCDNPNCINPEHLKEGTQKENVKDMVKKGRSKCTGKKGFTKEEIDFIRNSDLKIVELADKFNVHYQTIKKIINYRTYKNI